MWVEVTDNSLLGLSKTLMFYQYYICTTILFSRNVNYLILLGSLKNFSLNNTAEVD